MHLLVLSKDAIVSRTHIKTYLAELTPHQALQLARLAPRSRMFPTHIRSQVGVVTTFDFKKLSRCKLFKSYYYVYV